MAIFEIAQPLLWSVQTIRQIITHHLSQAQPSEIFSHLLPLRWSLSCTSAEDPAAHISPWASLGHWGTKHLLSQHRAVGLISNLYKPSVELLQISNPIGQKVLTKEWFAHFCCIKHFMTCFYWKVINFWAGNRNVAGTALSLITFR